MAKVSFSTDIRSLLRSFDIDSMKPTGLDSSSYEEMKKRVRDIYARFSAKDMPCDGDRCPRRWQAVRRVAERKFDSVKCSRES